MINKMVPGLIALLLLFPVCVQSAGQSLSQTGTESQKINLAVLNLKNASGITEGEASLISDRLRGELFNTGRANVMERDQMSEVLKEQGFQQSGACTDEACLVQMGQMLGVQAIVSGSIGKLGSMYLINFRVIDVKTGKITAVVSRDLKGDIEDVVEFLKDIATELVKGAAGGAPQGSGSAVQIQAAPRQQEKPVEKPVEEMQKEEPKEEQKEELKEEKTPETVDGNKEDMNKNRGGIRLMFGMNPGAPKFSINGKSYEPLNENWSVYGGSVTKEFSNSPLMRADIDFMIKAGQVIVVDIAPTLQWQSLSFKVDSTYSSYEKHWVTDATVGMAGVQPGVRFVKRFHPLKINVGVFADIGFAWWSSALSGTETDTYGFTENVSDIYGDTLLSNFGGAFLFAPGVRAGVEYLINNRVGFNFDFMFRYAAPSIGFIENFNYSAPDSKDRHIRDMLGYSSGYYNPIISNVDIVLPAFGIDFGVNFYF